LHITGSQAKEDRWGEVGTQGFVVLSATNACAQGEKVDDYWDSAKLLLTDPKFLDNLLTFNKDSIQDSVIQKLQPYIQSNDFRYTTTTATAEAISTKSADQS
jgi:hypothetical protein